MEGAAGPGERVTLQHWHICWGVGTQVAVGVSWAVAMCERSVRSALRWCALEMRDGVSGSASRSWIRRPRAGRLGRPGGVGGSSPGFRPCSAARPARSRLDPPSARSRSSSRAGAALLLRRGGLQPTADRTVVGSSCRTASAPRLPTGYPRGRRTRSGVSEWQGAGGHGEAAGLRAADLGRAHFAAAAHAVVSNDRWAIARRRGRRRRVAGRRAGVAVDKTKPRRGIGYRSQGRTAPSFAPYRSRATPADPGMLATPLRLWRRPTTKAPTVSRPRPPVGVEPQAATR